MQAPALNPAGAGNLWEMNWGCPVPGSEIAAVQFGALRTQAPSSLAVAVTGDRQALWIEGDVGMPQSPAGGRAYHVNLPGGQCNVHLTLTQMETRAQHARGYFIDNPRVFVRDVAPPVGGPAPPHARLDRRRLERRPRRLERRRQLRHRRHRPAARRRSRATCAGPARPASATTPSSSRSTASATASTGWRSRSTATAPAAAVAEGVIHLDRTPPAAGRPRGGRHPGRRRRACTGPSPTTSAARARAHAQVNAAGDGSTAGAWETLAGATGPGPHTAAVAVGVPDGVHAWRVVAADGAGNAGATPAPDRIIVDTTPPSVELHDVPGAWVRSLDLDLTATDNLQSALGLGATQIDVNAAADGGDAR